MIPDDIHPIIDIDNYDDDNYDNYGIKMIWTLQETSRNDFQPKWPDQPAESLPPGLYLDCDGGGFDDDNYLKK